VIVVRLLTNFLRGEQFSYSANGARALTNGGSSLSVPRALLVLLTACQVGGETTPTPDSAIADDGPSGGTPNTLALTFTTTTVDGPYSPLNCVVVWIESPGGTIIRTIDRKCDVRSQHLIAWNQKSGGPGADTDGVSGASRLNHQLPISVTWDLKDRLNGLVVDGTYTIRMELTESNATSPSQNHQGTFMFTKGAAPDVRTGLSNNGFEDVAITFTPP